MDVPTLNSESTKQRYPRGHHPNQLAALRPFKKGQNGNPHPGYAMKNRLNDVLRSKKMPADTCVGDEVVRATIEGALAREATPLIQVWDRVEGKAPSDAINNYNDNRSITIVVKSEEGRQALEALKSGRLPQLK